MLNFIETFVSNHSQFLLGFVAGAIALSLRWLRKHPEDWYSLEEIDPDIETDIEEEMYR